MASDTTPREAAVSGTTAEGSGPARKQRVLGRRARTAHPPQTLAGAFDPRRNSLAMMRVGLAGVVAVAHALSTGFGWQPSLGGTDLSALAVDGFFVLSGFLVTRSLLRLRSVRRYAWHRLLRLLPGFWACLLVIALVLAPLAALLEGRDPGAVLTAGEDPAWRYVLVNAGLVIAQHGIADLATPAGETALDGSLWTLQYEAACYGAVAVLLAVAGLRAQRRVLAVACVVVWAALLLESVVHIPLEPPAFANDQLLRFLLVFLLGAAGHVFADRLPVRWTWAVASGAVVVATAFLPDHRLPGAACFAYLCLYTVVRLPWRWTPSWDLSYGLYVYHWPVQFVLVLAGATGLGEWPFVVLSVAVSLCLAALSWVLVEGPALRLKDARWVGSARPVRSREPLTTPGRPGA
ncbi:peptidoglycan/LPS O-acetylase OafA/YrhL [Geodermatophilus bullaregiensis]|uniref:acyltransferase family protein n=1 Tax=Geodermatophilus bullaregiensis TaxID=1564160 RepID=UPI001956BA79|nr:acyltransferase [Geodermatophilus bullaregiensis]MBM7807016.1 peptidoglycan/LPS O-acetylase OafA/YrhL [Geodermatophilus bullaregiensis]